MKWVQNDGQVSSGQVLRRLGNRDSCPAAGEMSAATASALARAGPGRSRGPECAFPEDLKKNPHEQGKKENKMFVHSDPSHPSETACEDRAAANGL